MENYWIAIITPIATVVANAIYFALVKKQIDKRIESYKIAYSGIFKEKLDFYKQLLRNIDELRDQILAYGHGKIDHSDAPKIILEINKFIRLNQYGSIFYPEKIKGISDKIQKNFQDVFDASYKYRFLDSKGPVSKENYDEYIEKLGGLTRSDELSQLKSELITNIKGDFGIE